jgi:hypothetical protein
VAQYPRFFPLGNNFRDYPIEKNKFGSSNAAEFKYEVNMSSIPTCAELADDNSQDKNMVAFFAFLDAACIRIADLVFKDNRVGKDVKSATIGSLQSSRGPKNNTPITADVIQDHFRSMHVASPIKDKKAPADQAMGINADGSFNLSSTVPFTSSVNISDKVFKKNRPRSREQLASPMCSSTTKLHACMLQQGYIHNNIPMFDASDTKADANGNMTPIPTQDCTLTEGDVVSFQLRIVPYAFNSNSSKTGVRLEPVSIIFLRSDPSFKARRTEAAIAPKPTMVFAPGTCIAYSTMDREIKEDDPEETSRLIEATMAAEAESAKKKQQREQGDVPNNWKP